MASVHHVIIGLILIAAVRAKHQLWKILTPIILDCADNNTCKDLCVVEKMGIIDRDGRYVESKSLEWMKLCMDRGPLSRSQAEHIAKTCNRVNNKKYEDCAKGGEVTTCIKTEMKKLVPGIDKYRRKYSDCIWI
ncbi:uncharacterized protein LOC133534328 [Cydia pomonella]|uniref:uncharacterized protein LOC133534328 n=1 Tax=Cydia pomonella TaxID=82600 RepID=UPI002ADD7473|nr:uncharacterized protein LOC133534328 [Cydia pomonella]XP_061729433.1 uncharacterized protein LOC133534328 [Cydia pomonella]XP_061729434.1 uncharacterized protein LOC133534328 [Cydia pomonella]